MIKLYDSGVYLVNGTDIVEADQNAAAALSSRTSSVSFPPIRSTWMVRIIYVLRMRRT